MSRIDSAYIGENNDGNCNDDNIGNSNSNGDPPGFHGDREAFNVPTLAGRRRDFKG